MAITPKKIKKNEMEITLRLAFDAKREMLSILYACKKEIETMIKIRERQD